MTNGRYRARYRDASGKEHLKRFALKRDAQQWLDQETAKLQTGSWVAPKTAKTTMREWCQRWLQTYGTHKPSTLRRARSHCDKIIAEFGDRRLDSIKPSDVRSWTTRLREEGLANSYVYRLHGRLSQIMSDAVHDGMLARNPCSRRTAPPTGRQRLCLITTEQVWALYEAMEERYRASILLGAFAGLRVGEVCGLRVSDVEFMRGIIRPAVQYPNDELKTEVSRSPVPVPKDLALMLSRHVELHPSMWVLSDPIGRQLGPWALERAFREAKAQVNGLPEGLRFHDLRHYFASLLIASGCDVKIVQARLRHASPMTTLNTYSHLWPDSDETTNTAVSAAILRPGKAM
jgi:integrase